MYTKKIIDFVWKTMKHWNEESTIPDHEVTSWPVLNPDLATPSHLCWAWLKFVAKMWRNQNFFKKNTLLCILELSKPKKRGFWPYRHFDYKFFEFLLFFLIETIHAHKRQFDFGKRLIDPRNDDCNHCQRSRNIDDSITQSRRINLVPILPP